MINIGFTGSRHFGSRGWKVNDVIAHFNRVCDDLFVKVGDCPTGLDLIVSSYCEAMNIPGRVFVADWKTHGSAAGPIRNHEMVDSGIDLLVAYPEDDSKGTKDCAKYAHSQGVEVWFPELPEWAQWAAPIASTSKFVF